MVTRVPIHSSCNWLNCTKCCKNCNLTTPAKMDIRACMNANMATYGTSNVVGALRTAS